MSSPEGVVALVAQDTNGVVSTGFNISLLKVSTIVQGLLGLFVTTGVAVTAVGGITAIVAISRFSAPTPNNDFYRVSKHRWKKLDVLSNDESGIDDSTLLSISKLTQPSYGEARLVGRKIKYRANKYYTGKDSFAYKVKNDKLESNNYAVVNIDVKNSPPLTVDLSYDVARNAKTKIKLPIYKKIDREGDEYNDNGKTITDSDEDILVVTSVGEATHGKATFANNEVFYETNTQNIPRDSFTYTISDGNATSESTLSVYIKNSAPTAKPDVYRVYRNYMSIFDVLENDEDFNSDNLTITNMNPGGVIGSVHVLDNKIQFSPDVKKKKTYAFVFSYQISDGFEYARTTVTVQVLNRPPVVNDIDMRVPKNRIGILTELSYTDPDYFETLRATVIDANLGKWVSLIESSPRTEVGYAFDDSALKYNIYNYTWVYKATKQSYTEKVVYYVKDEGGLTGEGVINIEVYNEAPFAKPIEIKAKRGKETYISVKDSISDPNEDEVILDSLLEETTPKGAKVSIVMVNEEKFIKYVAPTMVSSGEVDTFTYVVVDEDNVEPLKTSSIVSVEIENDSPVAQDDTFYTHKNKDDIIRGVLDNDYDPNGDRLEIKQVRVNDPNWLADIPSIGKDKLSININTRRLFASTYTIEYVASDGEANSNVASIKVTIVNRAPITSNVTKYVHFRNALRNSVIIDLETKINDPDRDSVSLTAPTIDAVSTEQGNRVEVIPFSKKVQFTFSNTSTQTETFKYKVEDDDKHDKKTSDSIITIQLTNTAPVANGVSFSIHWRKGGSISKAVLLSNDTDQDGDLLAFSEIVTLPRYLNMIYTNEIISFSNKQPFKGADSFTYRINDSRDSAVGTVVLNITNIVPIAPKIEISTHWKATEISKQIIDTLIVKHGQYNLDGDDIFITSVSGISSGSVSISLDAKSIQYSPSGSFIGNLFGKYIVSDIVDTIEGDLEIKVTNNNKPTAEPFIEDIHWRDVKRNPGFVLELSNVLKDADGDDLTFTTSHVDTTFTNKDDKILFKYQRTKSGRGQEEFTYTVSDGISTSQSTITVNVKNSRPTALNASFVFNWEIHGEDGIIIDLNNYINDKDTQDQIHLSIEKMSNKGEMVSNNVLKYKPVGFDSAIVNIIYKAFDGLEYSDERTILVEIPDGSLDAKIEYYTFHWSGYTTGYDLELLKEKIDESGHNVELTGKIKKYPASGSLTLIDKYRMKYVPNSKRIRQDSFEVHYRNSLGDTNSLTAYIILYNNVPNVFPIEVSMHWKELTAKGISIVATFSSNDVDIQDKVLIDSYTQPSSGNVTRNANNLTYKLTDLGKKTDSFFFTLTDGLDTATERITIKVQNERAVVAPKSFDVHWRERNAGITLNVLDSNDYGGDFDAIEDLMVVFVSAPTEAEAGVLSISHNKYVKFGRGSLSSNFKGRFTFIILVSDGFEITPSPITMTVNVKNEKPVAETLIKQVHWRDAYTSCTIISNVLNEVTDSDTLDTEFRITSVFSSNSIPLSIVDDRIILDTKNSRVTFEEIQDIITYKVSDGLDESDEKTITIEFTNDIPEGLDCEYEKHWKFRVTTFDFSFSDKNSDPLSYVLPSESNTQGEVVLDRDGIATYTQITTNYEVIEGTKHSFTDTFKVYAMDKPGASLRKEATGKITIFNNKPIVSTKVYKFARDTSKPLPERKLNVIVDVSTDADSDDLTIIKTLIYIQGEGNNRVEASSDKKAIIYRPPSASFVGIETIAFVVTDGNLQTAGTISVETKNNLPECVDIVILGGIEKSSFPILWNVRELQCSDKDGDVLSYSLKQGTHTTGRGRTRKGFASLSNEVISYERGYLRSQDERIAVEVSDGDNVVEVFISFWIQNLGPSDIGIKELEDCRKISQTSYTLELLNGVYDQDGDGLIVESINQKTCASKGSFSSIQSDRRVVFTPIDGSHTTECEFEYTVKDIDKDKTIRKTGVYRINLFGSPPVAVDDYVTIDQSETSGKAFLISSLLSNDYDVNEDQISFVSISCPVGFCLETNKPFVSGSSVIYKTDGFKCNEDKFRYKVRTSDGVSAEATVFIKVTNCQCKIPLDVMFVMDGSGSISYSEWVDARGFVKKIAEKFDIGRNKVHVGLVQFGSGNVASYSDEEGFDMRWTDVPNRIGNIYNIGGGTNTLAGLHTGVDLLQEHSRKYPDRRNVPKVVVVVTDGNSNRPCDCSQCASFYWWWADTSSYSAAIKHCERTEQELPGLGNKDCSYCEKDYNNGMYCEPCSDPTTFAKKLNKLQRDADWKVVAIGAGDSISAKGINQVRQMNYDPTRAFVVDWDKLDDIVQAIVDETCNENKGKI